MTCVKEYGFDGLTRRRQLVDNRNIEVAEDYKPQGSRNRRCAHYEQVGIFALRQQLCALCYAETVLFVGHGYAEVVKLGFVGDQRVSADYQVDFSALKLCPDALFFAFLKRACQKLDLDACILQELFKGFKMLSCQNFGRRHKRRLKAVFDDGIADRGSYGGFTGAYVALNKAVHRRGFFLNIINAVGYCSFLRVCECKRQVIFEFFRIVILDFY